MKKKILIVAGVYVAIGIAYTYYKQSQNGTFATSRLSDKIITVATWPLSVAGISFP